MNLPNSCQAVLDNKEAIKASGLLLVFVWEWWLGKTDKVKAASTAELLYNLFRGPGAAPEAPQQEEKKNG